MSSVYRDLVLDSSYRPDFKLTIREFASGMVELITRRVDHMREAAVSRDMGFRGVSRPKTDEEKEAAKEDNLRRAESRARLKIRHLIQSIGADHLLTLTYRENMEDSEKLASDFTKFVRAVRDGFTFNGRRYEGLGNWQYVAVKEFQERGSLHMHIACVGKQNVEHLRRCWYYALGADINSQGDETPGAINVRYKKQRFSGQSPVFSALQLAVYLSKYISKTFDHDKELGQRRYKASRGIPAPRIRRQYLGACSHVHGTDTLVVMMKETLSHAEFMGVGEYQIWLSPDQDVFIIRGVQS